MTAEPVAENASYADYRSQEIAGSLDVLERAGVGDEKDLVEAQLLHPFDAPAGLVGRADERDIGSRGNAR